MKVFLAIFFIFLTNDYFCQPNYWQQFPVSKSDFIYIAPKMPNENYMTRDTVFVVKYVYDPKELQKIACLSSSTFFYQYKKCISKIK